MKRSLGIKPVDFLLFPSLIGCIAVLDGPAGIQGILLGKEREALEAMVLRICPSGRPRQAGRLGEACLQILEYLEGRRRTFHLHLDFRSLSSFQKEVYGELVRVPYGTTVSYRGLAERVGRPRAARAVGRAMAVNPFPLVVPCHRVVAADGSLRGFSGGEGIATKEQLLAMEKAASGAAGESINF
ncbi:MAG: methylated-DNA--[protein]-cysteine S-methyltransferase [Deltaproteobacteria bacterium]|nr:methylated-DNA--[protein]-cysteine S-methyltransferase [Deltaproteobacteria bacterium]